MLVIFGCAVLLIGTTVTIVDAVKGDGDDSDLMCIDPMVAPLPAPPAPAPTATSAP